jgi:hypothetical protein
MSSLTPPTSRRTALLAASAVGVASLAAFLTVAAGGDISPRLDLWYLVGFVGLFAVGAFVTPAVPVYAYLRHGLRSPLVVFAADLLLWFVVVPSVGAPDASTLPFAVGYWPVYLALFAVAGWLERRFGGRGRSADRSAT